ncbi:hypothetical protein L1280_001122 [Deinococcus sp. HSC-46F16]|uniref:hypothetical protein n=1 Tax=unclassified Deinococcus TaxID=2623546 RepID=UPI000CF5725A|nr:MULTISPECIES: hypothetical protein [unclassified Deinococcus]MCP2013985.1 hypothetical protein [Deinococcus sp. HSC-46F16]
MTKYYMVGAVPVKVIKQPGGQTVILAFNAHLGQFESNSRYYSMIRRDDTGLVRPVTEEAFGFAVEQLQQRAS